MSERIRVATYNLYLGADLALLLGEVPGAPSGSNPVPRPDGDLGTRVREVLRQLEVTAFPRRARAVARLLAREQVDLVGLQEVCTWRKDGEVMWDCTDVLLRELADLGEEYDVVATQPSFSGSGQVERDGRRVTMELDGRNVILRRRRSHVVVEEASSGMFAAALAVQLMDAAEVTIGRGWCAVRCTVGGTGFTFANTHTEAYEATSRDDQRSELMDAMTALPTGDGRLVLVGDFNALPDQVGMAPQMSDAWVEAGHAVDAPDGWTCRQAGDLANPTSGLSERIDYVWVRGVRVEASARLGAAPEERTDAGLWPSDHAGVTATLLVG